MKFYITASIIFFYTLPTLLAQVDLSYVYGMPTGRNRKVFISQGYCGRFSHRNQFALDFKLKEGSPVYAAREGVVYRCASNYTQGGANRKYSSQANYIIIEHEDGSYAAYWHLKHNGVKVAKGERVSKGQMIGYSGNTGWSTSAHLHFEVYAYNEKGYQVNFPTQFETSSGVKRLKAYRFYTN